MQITPEQKQLIESIIKEAPGFKNNEYLLEEFYNETIRRAYNLISSPKDISIVKPYLKRVINSVIIEIIKISSDNFTENQDIQINYDFSLKELNNDKNFLTQDKISKIKQLISKMDKNIFEFRYIKGLSNKEIAEKLEIDVDEVDQKLLLMLQSVREEVFTE